MKYALSFATALSVQMIGGVMALPQTQSPGITMNTPTNLVTCEPVQLTWSGGQPPYFLSVQDGNNPSGTSLERFDQQSTTSYTWTVNTPAKKTVIFLLRDSAGSTSVTAPVGVEDGASDTCVNQNISFAPPSNGTTAAVPPAAAPMTAATPPTPASSAPAGSDSTASPTSGGAADSQSTSTSNGALSGAPKLGALLFSISAMFVLFV